MIRFTGLRAVVLDIEGTTCPVDFVSSTLFPYAHRHLEAHLAQPCQISCSSCARPWRLCLTCSG